MLPSKMLVKQGLPDTPSGYSLYHYVEGGHPVGHFLTAIITNDLQGAVSHADDDNLGLIPAYVKWLFNRAPSMCYGNRELMDKWMEVGGLQGLHSMDLDELSQFYEEL